MDIMSRTTRMSTAMHQRHPSTTRKHEGWVYTTVVEYNLIGIGQHNEHECEAGL